MLYIYKYLSPKNACTIRSPSGLIASSGILRKSLRLDNNLRIQPKYILRYVRGDCYEIFNATLTCHHHSCLKL